MTEEELREEISREILRHKWTLVREGRGSEEAYRTLEAAASIACGEKP